MLASLALSVKGYFMITSTTVLQSAVLRLNVSLSQKTIYAVVSWSYKTAAGLAA